MGHNLEIAARAAAYIMQTSNAYVCSQKIFLHLYSADNIPIFCRFLQATVAGVNPSQPPCVRISAVRAVSEYCAHLSSTDRTHILQPFIGSMVDGLLSVMTQFSTDVIALCLETLCVVLAVMQRFPCHQRLLLSEILFLLVASTTVSRKRLTLT